MHEWKFRAEMKTPVMVQANARIVGRKWLARVAAGLLLVVFFCPRWARSADEAPAKAKAEAAQAAPADQGAVDPRFRSPKATVRWFLAAINAAEENPARIEDASACLDLSEVPPEQRDPGRLAFELERILQSLKTPTWLLPEHVDGSEYTVGDKPGLKVTLRRMPDGRWLFDSKTVASLRSMVMTLFRQNAETPPTKESSEAAAEFQSPQAMFRTFVGAMKKGELDVAAQCLDLGDIPSPAQRTLGRELAVKLKHVLDRTVFVIYQDLPGTNLGEPLEAVVSKDGRIVAERQPTGARKDNWLFNRATVESLDRLYDAYEDAPIMPELSQIGTTSAGSAFRHSHGLWLRTQMPGWLKQRIRFTQKTSFLIYQLLGMALLAVVVVPVYRVVVKLSTRLARWLLRWRNRRDAARRAGLELAGIDLSGSLSPEVAACAVPGAGTAAADVELVTSWARPMGALAVVWLLAHGILLLDLREEAAGVILSVLMPLDWLAGTLVLYHLVDPAIRFVFGSAVTSQGAITRAAMGFPVISLVLKFVVIGFGLSAVLELFKFDVTTVLAGLGIGGLAFALAAQDTLKNFFGSIMLIWDRTFRVGDRVRIGDHEGLIESVGLRTTRIRGLDDSLLTIPNSDLTTEHVTNFGARRFRRFRTAIAVNYGTPLERVIQFRDGIVELIRARGRVRPDRFAVAVNDLGSSAIEILVEVFFDVPDERAELAARDELIVDILRLADRLGIAPLSQVNPAASDGVDRPAAHR
ncbi:MAG TPA: mechanosensitive ion channel family protein [Pirellulales bacterium]|nr:mechanosensitive ion channel family protein [Pirellulales bacterium]